MTDDDSTPLTSSPPPAWLCDSCEHINAGGERCSRCGKVRPKADGEPTDLENTEAVVASWPIVEPPVEELDVKASLIACVVAACVLRLEGVTAPWFQAGAHLLVGGLLGAGFAAPAWRKFCFALALVASVVEVVVFLVGVL